ncbi:SixA phosphatase family protein [Thermovibrio sp.]
MGKRVFLVRHAKALKREEWKGDDCKRPLTEKGKEEFREFLKWLKPVFPKRAKVVSSPCERALKTAQIISDFLGYDLKVENSLMPDAEPEDYEKVITKHRGNLILVGHEPDLSLFLNYITCISPSRLAFKKGAVAEIRKSKGVWKLFAFYNPSSL